MTTHDNKFQFEAQLLRPAQLEGDRRWAFIILPKELSAKLARRGRITVEASINGHGFQITLEPDGQLSHWFKVSEELMVAADTDAGSIATVEISSLPQEPEPDVPDDLRQALEGCPSARQVWDGTTAIARVDWIHWITTAKQVKTRVTRINNACDMLSKGKRRVCCFDPSGYYSKAFSSPKTAD